MSSDEFKGTPEGVPRQEHAAGRSAQARQEAE